MKDTTIQKAAISSSKSSVCAVSSWSIVISLYGGSFYIPLIYVYILGASAVVYFCMVFHKISSVSCSSLCSLLYPALPYHPSKTSSTTNDLCLVDSLTQAGGSQKHSSKHHRLLQRLLAIFQYLIRPYC